MNRLHIIILFLVLTMALSFTACTKKQEGAEPVIRQTDLSQITAPSPTITILPTTSPVPTESPKQTQPPTPTVAPTQTEFPDGEGSSDTESGILPADEEAESTKDSSTDTSKVRDNISKGRLIAIDAGHQSKGNNEKEPIGPGSSTTKPKVSSGTRGIATDVPEYKLNLAIAIKVQEELLNRGYDVYMIRETNDVNLSNRERAEMANESGADLFIRIHADGSENTEVSGTSTLYPSEDNPYVAYLYKDSYALSKAIVDAMCDRTGAKNRGAIARDDMSGINWCDIPVSIIEMGYMSNKREDKLMQTEEYQNKMVQGICDGIDAYYN